MATPRWTGAVGHAPLKSVSLACGPVSADAVLAMAALTGDYCPLRTWPKVAEGAGHRGAQVHCVWISGLVSAGLGALVPRAMVRRLTVEYHRPAFQGERLLLAMTYKEPPARELRTTISFQITNENGDGIADGMAEIVRTGA